MLLKRRESISLVSEAGGAGGGAGAGAGSAGSGAGGGGSGEPGDRWDVDIQLGELLYRLLQSSHHLVRESCARLLNALASYAQGRSYLLKHPGLLGALVGALQSESHDSAIRQHAVACLQKCSLRRHPQTAMINMGVLEWLFTALLAPENVGRLSEYSREYGTALLMNLSLRTAAKKRCEGCFPQALAAIKNLLDHSNAQVRTYVNGTLYSLLSRPVTRLVARSTDLDAVISSLMQKSDDRFKKQLDCIGTLLRKEPSAKVDQLGPLALCAHAHTHIHSLHLSHNQSIINYGINRSINQ